ncbi:calcium-translocating P-type ATPase, SERCA-type [Anaerosporobacter faecicola]|uniref:calcium-translocating P-type ATPase, SERCA-type n=1 Tax=Anaerosporobacter faecicola TaxID=2718714 RepID=UPI00143B8872|nr:calcium-translocating P-type ATPase, SERCA-type [Anaerosporobacter faecicola]
MNYHNLSAQDTAKLLHSDAESGLTSKEAAKRIHEYGENVLETKKNKSIVSKFFSQFKDFMIAILIVAAIISFAISVLEGHADFVDPIIIFAIIILNAVLGVLQETKAERSLEALKNMTAPTATVIRNGCHSVISSKELVPGDLIQLETGHYVPADARLLTAINLRIDESALTGESHPIEKNADKIYDINTPLADRKNLVYATSIVSYGRGCAIVTSTGMHTEVGHIAKLIMADDTPDTPLQKRLAVTGKVLGIAALLICLLIFLLGTIQGRPPFDMFMTSVSLAVAAIPEGLPAIVTIMLSLGVSRMAKKNAVIRKLPAVETLGSATVICSDKTGTLTQNQMTVTDLYSIHGKVNFDSKEASHILTLGSLCNDSTLKVTKNDITATGEPTENAIILAACKVGINKAKLDLSNKRVSEIPFDSSRKLMTTINKMENEQLLCITKGAPDVLLSRCTHYYDNGKISPLTNAKRAIIQKYNTDMAKRALRVLAVAYKETSKIIQGTALAESTLIFTGLIGMIDPPRPEAKDAVRICKQAGITPIMITGDHITTACAIAKELGILEDGDKSLTGTELSVMSEETLNNTIDSYRVFARVTPEHKVRIVKAFQKKGNVVAMTGDGVNDAPALKTADIGCAMGLSGTDVAKNASDMILTDDNFATIVSAVQEGRGIYQNIRKAIHFLLSSNIGEILTIFAAILLGLPSPLLAVQLLWVNLVTDSLPAISLGVEAADKDIMKNKPIPPSTGMFANGLVFKILFEGLLIGSLALTAFILGYRYNIGGSTDSLTLGRTMAFAVLSLSQLFHSFNMRSDKSILTIGIFSNIKHLLSFIVCTILLTTVITFEPLAMIFKVLPLNAKQWVSVGVLSFVPILIVEIQKRVNNNH